MDGERIFGLIIMCAVCFGCAGIFSAVASWAERKTDPMHFYSGTTVDPSTISDIPAYNHANARMWRIYSTPYWIAGILEIMSVFYEPLSMVAVFLMVAAGTLGILWIIRKYRKICETYIIR